MTAEQRMFSAFREFCSYLDGRNLKYNTTQTDKGDNKISIIGKGKDLSIDIRITFDASNEVISLLSPLPFNFKEKIIEGAVVCSVVTNRLREGSFDYDLEDGSVYFRLTNSVMGITVSRELCTHIFTLAVNTIDTYNDKMLAVAKGMMSPQEFIEKIKV